VGDEVQAKVLKFDQEKNRVSLGMKQLGEDPWVGIARRFCRVGASHPPASLFPSSVTSPSRWRVNPSLEAQEPPALPAPPGRSLALAARSVRAKKIFALPVTPNSTFRNPHSPF